FSCSDSTSFPALDFSLTTGSQRLSGAEVIAYLRCAEADSRGRGLLAQQEVLAGMMRAGMGLPEVARQQARALHLQLRSNLLLGDLFNLAEMARATPRESLQTGILPTLVESVDGEQRVEPHIVQTTRLVARLLRGMNFLVPEDVQVAVFNGNGARDLARRTGDFLRARSFPVVHTGNAERFDYERTFVVHYGDADKARLVADALPDDAPVTVLTADRFQAHLRALEGYVPAGTDVLVVVGVGFEVDDG
ncbi:MAG: LytR C-terminal domain-containing protein, partial [Candidatus Bipolaricaulota bacterium]